MVPRRFNNLVLFVDALFFVALITLQIAWRTTGEISGLITKDMLFLVLLLIIIISFISSGIWWISHVLAKWHFDRKGKEKNTGFVARVLDFIPNDQ